MIDPIKMASPVSRHLPSLVIGPCRSNVTEAMYSHFLPRSTGVLLSFGGMIPGLLINISHAAIGGERRVLP